MAGKQKGRRRVLSADAEKEFAESAPKNARVLVMKWPKTISEKFLLISRPQF